MAATPANMVEVDPRLLERARKEADERGVAVPQLVNTALEHELGSEKTQPGSRIGDEGEQPPLTCIGAFRSGRGDLSKLASEDVFEPEPFR
ncbi:MAG TPA: hypothetical protein VFY04_06610 [Solirubrobacterales bacterium]|nr:hypothetical protein [Solirubrobacterales bacterium]